MKREFRFTVTSYEDGESFTVSVVASNSKEAREKVEEKYYPSTVQQSFGSLRS